MRSKKIEFRMSWVVYEAAQALCRQRQMRSIGRYFTALAIDDMLDERRREMSRAIAECDPEEQDAFIDYVNAIPRTRAELHAWLQTNVRAQKEAKK